ncbi:HAD family phosphatase [Candidatus Saccharibacteria bacterium]|nr:MAG: HAD family phosphatase [Candidatus Saccharibacteria bacterium]
MSIRAIIFDLYGVLGLNGWQSFKAHHFSTRPEEWERLRALGQRVDAGLEDQDTFVAAVARVTGEEPAAVRYQFEHTTLNSELLDYISDVLKPDYKIGLLSNASYDVFDSLFSHDQLELFDEAMSSFHVGLTKPNPRMFRLMCERLGVDPTQAIMIDDQQRHIDAAGKMGLKTVLYTSVEQTKRDVNRLLSS